MVSGSSGGSSGYDSLHRLGAATQVPITGSTQYFCWSYDSYGNRTYQQSSSAAFTNTAAVNTGTSNTCDQASGSTLLASEWNNYYATSGSPSTDPGTNQIQTSNGSGSTATFTYDAAGNVTYDGSSHYLYDAEGQQCAIENGDTIIGYVYDAEGNRVAKGTLASFSCTATFTPTHTYIVDQANQQITETDGSGNWLHSNVFAGGALIATYDYKSDGTNPLSFNLVDWLGTKRVVTDYTGTVTETWSSQPFGDGLTELYGSSDDTEHHFTQKERDSETGIANGNDYMFARYYGSSTGRFLSPDWSAKVEATPYSHLENPQSLNLYMYVLNNPFGKPDIDGHGCPPDCSQDKGSTEDRVITGLTGAANLFIGTARGVETVADFIATPVTGGASTVLGLYEAGQTTAQASAGGIQLWGAITGNTKYANNRADNAMVHTSVIGYTVLKATHGNLDTASKAAAVEGLVSSAATRSIFKSAAKVLDTLLNIHTLSAKPSQPPPPQQPPPAQQPQH